MQSQKQLDALTPRRPKQARSRARFEAILDAAEAVVAKNGMAHLTMSEVALCAGVSIGSLYQYMPTPKALLRALTDRFLAAWREDLTQRIDDARTPQELSDAIAAVIWQIYQDMRLKPQQRELWAYLNADRDLAAFNLADSRANSALFVAALVRVGVIPQDLTDDLLPDALLVTHLSGAATQMAAELPAAEGDRLVQVFAGMAAERAGLPAPGMLSPSNR